MLRKLCVKRAWVADMRRRRLGKGKAPALQVGLVARPAHAERSSSAGGGGAT